jgi:membrane protein YdbS with pleckstrin-like domain
MFKTLLSSSLKHPKNVNFEGEDNDEHITYVFRRSFITNFDWIVIAVLLLITPWIAGFLFVITANEETIALIPTDLVLIAQASWFLFTFGYIFQNFINWFFNLYIITSKRIIDVDFIGLLFKNISEAPLYTIQDVTSEVKGTTKVVFNYGTVHIQTAGERREFQFEDVHNPSYVRDIISDIIIDLGEKK